MGINNCILLILTFPSSDFPYSLFFMFLTTRLGRRKAARRAPPRTDKALEIILVKEKK